MSYRSFKRVLGETSLERKCRFLFGACLLLLITGSFWWYGKQTEGLVYKQNPGKGRLIVDTVLTRTHWEKLETNEAFKKIVPLFSEDLEQQDFTYRFIGLTSAPAIEKPENAFEKRLIEKLS